MDTTKPIQTFRDSDRASIAASVWLRKTASAGVFYDVTVARAYKKSDTESGYSQSFGDRDLDALQRVLQRAKDYIQQRKDNSETVRGSDAFI